MELFRLVGTIALDNTEAERAINDTTNAARNAESETSKAFQKIGGSVKTVALAIGGAGLAMGGAFIAAVEGTREYRNEMALLDSAFQTAGHTSETAKNTYSELNSIIGDSGAAVEASQHLALLTDNEQDLQKWTDICTGVYATFGASLPIEGLTEAANHTAKVGEVQGSLADALEWSGISVDDFNAQLAECSTEEERQKLITETLNNTYKKASDQYKETNKDIIESRKAQERLSDAMAEIGRVGEPIMTAIRNGMASLVETAVPAVEKMIEKVKDATTWVKENKETIEMWTGIILGAATAIGTFLLIMNWSSIMTKASAALGVVRTAVLGFNAALMANPIGIVVGLLAGLVVAFIYLWNNCEGFRQFWLDLWDVIKNAASVACEWIKSTFASIGTWFGEKFAQVKKFGKDAMDSVSKVFSDAWTSIKKIWDKVQPYFQAIWNHIKLVFSVVKNVLTGNFSGAWEGIKGIWNNAKNFFSGIWSGIKNVFSSVGSWFGGIFSGAWSAIKNAFSNWGSFFGKLWGDVKSKFGDIGAKIGSTMGGAVKTAMNSVIGLIEGAINKGIGLINSAIDLANKLPTVNVGKVPKLKLPRMAQGGVLEKGQIGLLEGSGAEAVVPLENNRKWIQKVANEMDSMRPSADLEPVNRRIEKLISLMEEFIDMKIYLDSGALVGELTPTINMKLGDMYAHELRGNTR